MHVCIVASMPTRFTRLSQYEGIHTTRVYSRVARRGGRPLNVRGDPELDLKISKGTQTDVRKHKYVNIVFVLRGAKHILHRISYMSILS